MFYPLQMFACHVLSRLLSKYHIYILLSVCFSDLQELEKLLEVLEGVVNLASAAINQQEIYVPVSLYSTSVVLNGTFYYLHETVKMPLCPKKEKGLLYSI